MSDNTIFGGFAQGLLAGLNYRQEKQERKREAADRAAQRQLEKDRIEAEKAWHQQSVSGD